MMKRVMQTVVACGVLLGSVGMLQAGSHGGAVMVSEGWVREMPPNMRMSAAFMVLMNHSMDAVSLTGVTSAQFERVEMHRSMPVDGVMRMVEQPRIPVPAHGQTILKPGDWHIMLMMGKGPIKSGDQIDLTLTFDNKQTLKVALPVKKMSTQGGMMHHGKGMMDHGKGMMDHSQHMGQQMMQKGMGMMHHDDDDDDDHDKDHDDDHDKDHDKHEKEGHEHMEHMKKMHH
ncbi:copper chaperone PCu(A)C [Magnetococcus sp. PR-3]|uniref:copper chaperone PCu(A)C n=1 Tax=Magnetococcus sp. PR-3 TaxID=3120355 RepID=UPI002FCE61E8